MEPKIIERGNFYIVGMKCTEFEQIGITWHDFFSRMDEIKNVVNDRVFYGISECECAGGCECESAPLVYIAGREVENLDNIPAGMVGRSYPASRYAVFTYNGTAEQLPQTFNDIFSRWLAASELEPTNNYAFEYYDQRFKNFEEGSEIDLYIPVK